MNGLRRGGCWFLIIRAEVADEAALFFGGGLVVEGDKAGEQGSVGVSPNAVRLRFF